jgi:hypothetical protein
MAAFCDEAALAGVYGHHGDDSERSSRRDGSRPVVRSHGRRVGSCWGTRRIRRRADPRSRPARVRPLLADGLDTHLPTTRQVARSCSLGAPPPLAARLRPVRLVRRRAMRRVMTLRNQGPRTQGTSDGPPRGRPVVGKPPARCQFVSTSATRAVRVIFAENRSAADQILPIV